MIAHSLPSPPRADPFPTSSPQSSSRSRHWTSSFSIPRSQCSSFHPVRRLASSSGARCPSSASLTSLRSPPLFVSVYFAVVLARPSQGRIRPSPLPRMGSRRRRHDQRSPSSRADAAAHPGSAAGAPVSSATQSEPLQVLTQLHSPSRWTSTTDAVYATITRTMADASALRPRSPSPCIARRRLGPCRSRTSRSATQR